MVRCGSRETDGQGWQRIVSAGVPKRSKLGNAVQRALEACQGQVPPRPAANGQLPMRPD